MVALLVPVASFESSCRDSSMLVIEEEEEEEEGRIRLRCRAGRWHDDVSIYDEIAGPLGVRGAPDATRVHVDGRACMCKHTQAPSKHATSPGSPGVSQSRS